MCISKKYLRVPYNFDVRDLKNRVLIAQYTLNLVYWPIKLSDSLGLWHQSSTGHVSIILDMTLYTIFLLFMKKFKWTEQTYKRI